MVNKLDSTLVTLDLAALPGDPDPDWISVYTVEADVTLRLDRHVSPAGIRPFIFWTSTGPCIARKTSDPVHYPYCVADHRLYPII